MQELLDAVRLEINDVKSSNGIEPYTSRTRRVVSDADRLISSAFAAPTDAPQLGQKRSRAASLKPPYVVPESAGCAAYSHRGALAEFTVQLTSVSGLLAGSKLHADEAMVAKSVALQAPSIASVEAVHALALDLCEYRSACSWRSVPPYQGYDPKAPAQL